MKTFSELVRGRTDAGQLERQLTELVKDFNILAAALSARDVEAIAKKYGDEDEPKP